MAAIIYQVFSSSSNYVASSLFPHVLRCYSRKRQRRRRRGREVPVMRTQSKSLLSSPHNMACGERGEGKGEVGETSSSSSTNESPALYTFMERTATDSEFPLSPFCVGISQCPPLRSICRWGLEQRSLEIASNFFTSLPPSPKGPDTLWVVPKVSEIHSPHPLSLLLQSRHALPPFSSSLFLFPPWMLKKV